MTGSKIMIVEDEALVSMVLKETLTMFGYNVTSIAYNGYDAIQKAGENRPDLILMDVNLEGDIDGIETAERILDLYDIPVIYLSAYSDTGTLLRAMKTQPYGYLLKPFEQNDLYKNIERALYKYKIKKKLNLKKDIIDSTLSHIPDAFIAVNTEGKINMINSLAEEMTGWKNSEIKGEDFCETFSINTKGTTELMSLLRKKGNNQVSMTYWPSRIPIVTKQDETIHISINIILINDKKGNINQILFILRPKSDSNVIDNVLNSPIPATEKGIVQYYGKLLDAINYPIFIISRKLKLIYYNRAFMNICLNMGLTINATNQPIYEIMPSVLIGTMDDYQDIFDSGTGRKKERTFKKAGDVFSLYTETFPLSITKKGEKSVDYVATIIFDITKEVDRKLRDDATYRDYMVNLELVEEISELTGKLENSIYACMKLTSSLEGSGSEEIINNLENMKIHLADINEKWREFEIRKKTLSRLFSVNGH